MSARAERRRREREAAKRRSTVLIAGDGIVATELKGHRFEAVPHAELPAKRPGEHRWVATAGYVVSVEQAAAAMDPDTLKFLDQENLFYIGIGCWDCERPLGVIEVDSRCPAEATE